MAAKQPRSSRYFFTRGTLTTALFWWCLMTLSLHTSTTMTHGLAVLPSTTYGRIGASVSSTPTTSSSSQRQQPPRTISMAMVRKKKQPPVSIEDDKSTGKNENRQRNQQFGAVAVVVFGVLYDFFITHQGVGFWDPNYVV